MPLGRCPSALGSVFSAPVLAARFRPRCDDGPHRPQADPDFRICDDGGEFHGDGLIPGIEHLIYPFLIIYGLSYFFTEFGPNATTFVYPAELFPVEGRTTGHGVASAMSKIGGFVGVFTFPLLMAWHGLLTAEMGAAAASVLGLVVTLTLLPETKGRSLEELSKARPASAAA